MKFLPGHFWAEQQTEVADQGAMVSERRLFSRGRGRKRARVVHEPGQGIRNIFLLWKFS